MKQLERTWSNRIGCLAGTLIATGASAVSAAPVLWTNGHSYEAVRTPAYISFLDAKAAAEARGGHLATVASAAENNFIYSLASADPTMWHIDGYGNGIGPWLGGYQYDKLVEPNGHWTWVTGESWVFSNWAIGEPNNSNGNEDYLHLFGYQTFMSPGWNDLAADAWPLGYVVEWIPEPTVWSLLMIAGGLPLRRSR